MSAAFTAWSATGVDYEDFLAIHKRAHLQAYNPKAGGFTEEAAEARKRNFEVISSTTCSTQGTRRHVKGVAVLVVLHVVVHGVQQGTLRNVRGVAVPVALHVVLQETLRNVKGVSVPKVPHVVPQGTGCGSFCM